MRSKVNLRSVNTELKAQTPNQFQISKQKKPKKQSLNAQKSMNSITNVQSAILIWKKSTFQKSLRTKELNQLQSLHKQLQLTRKTKIELSLRIQWLLKQINKQK